ncbi:MAG: hypothetical protein EOO09_06345 [Chitinophagaceae bacterium]|nr:MAG: hypothetical protein EOO09_06345 [Chitinophagaceae bacterium]
MYYYSGPMYMATSEGNRVLLLPKNKQVDKGKQASVFFHNYYGDHARWAEMLRGWRNPFDLYYNIVENSLYNQEISAAGVSRLFREKAGEDLQDFHLRFSPNLGKDIGGKLLLLDSWLKNTGAEGPLLFLHDKRSPQKPDPGTWSRKLLGIGEPEFVLRALAMFRANPGIGIITAAGTVMRNGSSNPLLQQLSERYGLNGRVTEFVAGTMFWCSARPVRDFFTRYSPLEIRATMEQGNVMDEEGETVTHSWERLLSAVVTASGGSITELEL